MKTPKMKAAALVWGVGGVGFAGYHCTGLQSEGSPCCSIGGKDSVYIGASEVYARRSLYVLQEMEL